MHTGWLREGGKKGGEGERQDEKRVAWIGIGQAILGSERWTTRMQKDDCVAL